MNLPEGAIVAEVEEKRIADALAALKKDHRAPHEVSVRVTLHVHREYPKHIVVGKDKDDAPIVKVAANAKEEAELTKTVPVKEAEPAQEAEKETVN
jgi:hypothetical protein